MYHAYRYRFLSLESGSFETLSFEPRELTFLPSGERRRVKLHELKSLVELRGYPWSMLAAYFAGVEYVRTLPDEPTFINVQVVEGIPTTIELYNSRVGYRAYGDFQEAWRDATDVVVAIGAFNYHFRNLAKVLPGEFYTYRSSSGKRLFFAPRRKLGIDITFFSLLATGEGPYRLAAEQGVPRQEPIALARFMYEYLEVPKLFNILSSLLNIDRHQMQITFRDKLKTYIVYQAYLDRGYILEDLPRRDCDANSSQVYVRHPGVYYDMVEYDISMAYPTTVVVDRIDPYGVDVFPTLMERLRTLRTQHSGVPTKFVKLLANSLIGMLRYEHSGFRNECAHARVLNGVYSRWRTIAEDSVWANVDSAILPADLPAPKIDGYEVRPEHRFKWVAVIDSQRLLGETYDGDFIHKGIRISYHWGEAVRLPTVWARADSALDFYIAAEPNRVFRPIEESVDTIQRIVLDAFTDSPDEYVLYFVRSKREAVKNPFRAYVFPRLKETGVTSGVLTKDGFKDPAEVSLSEIDWRFYTTATVFSLFDHFERYDSKVTRSLAAKLARKLGERYG